MKKIVRQPGGWLAYREAGANCRPQPFHLRAGEDVDPIPDYEDAIMD